MLRGPLMIMHSGTRLTEHTSRARQGWQSREWRLAHVSATQQSLRFTGPRIGDAVLSVWKSICLLYVCSRASIRVHEQKNLLTRFTRTRYYRTWQVAVGQLWRRLQR